MIRCLIPRCVINNEAYDRMLRQLQSGEPHVWSYKNICPCSRKEDCRCTKHKNILNAEGEMVRVIGGVQKPVLRSSEFIAMCRGGGQVGKLWLRWWIRRASFAKTEAPTYS